MRDLMRKAIRNPLLLAVLAGAPLLIASGVLAGCGAGDEEKAPATVQEADGSPQRSSFLARLIPRDPTRRASSTTGEQAAAVARLLKDMPVEQKVAQLFALGFPGQDLTDGIFEEYGERDIGAVVFNSRNYVDSAQVASLTNELIAISQREGRIAPWILVPQEGGQYNAFADLPPATAPVNLSSDGEAADEAAEAAAALRPLGFNGVLAPVVDVAPAGSPAVGGRAYSNDPVQVSHYARAVVGAYRAASMLSAASHFPGIGSGSEDTRFGPSNVSLDLDQIRSRDLVPFAAAIRAGVPAVTISNGLYVTDDFVTPGTLSRAITTGLLREDLDFRGIAITDDLADPAITALTSIPEAAVDAVRAGSDLLYISGPPAEQQAAYDAVLKAVKDREIGARRLDEAVGRTLGVKRDYGLIEE